MDRHQELETILGALESQIREATEGSVKRDILEAERLYYSKELLDRRAAELKGWIYRQKPAFKQIVNLVELGIDTGALELAAERANDLRELAQRYAAYVNELKVCEEPLNG